jgi:hypothetical protein
VIDAGLARVSGRGTEPWSGLAGSGVEGWCIGISFLMRGGSAREIDAPPESRKEVSG